MNKFDQTFISIKKIILEESSFDNYFYYIDFDLSLMRDKYCDGGIWYNDLIKKSKIYNIKVEILEKNINQKLKEIEKVKVVRLKCNNKQQLIKFLSSFINSKEFDYICSFIKRSN